MKRLIITLLVFILVFSSAYAEEKTFGESEKIGSIITNVQIGSGAVSMQGEEPVIAAVTQGNPSKLEIVNLNTGRLKSVFELEGCTNLTRTMLTFENGDIYFNCNQYMFCYTPSTDTLSCIGNYGSSSTISISEGENGDIYFTTYPDAKIKKFNGTTKNFSTIAELQQVEGKTNANYVYGINYYNNNLYYVRWTDNKDGLTKLDLTSGEQTVYPFPEGISSIKYIQKKNDYLLCYTIGEDSSVGIVAFDLINHVWSDILDTGVYDNRFFTPVIDNKVYYTKNGKFCGIDLNTLETFRTEISGWNISGSGNSIVKLSDETLGDGCYANLTFSGDITLINFSNQNTKKISADVFEPAKSVINSLNVSENGKLYIGEYMGTQAVEYDIYKKTVRKFSASQIGSMAFIDNKAYFGCYPEGSLSVFDSAKNTGASNPQKLLNLGEKQQRLRNMIEAEGKIIIASFPEYANLGGALTVYDPISNAADVKRNIIENQSVLALAYADGIVYGGTSVSGGLGIDAVEDNAKIFIFNLETKEKILEKELIIPGSEYPVQSVRGLAVTQSGDLIGTADNYVFKLDAATLELVDYELIGNQAHTIGGQQKWYLSRMYFDEYTGLYYFSEKNSSSLKTLEPDSFVINDTGITVSNLYVLAPDRCIYTMIDSELYKIELPSSENRECSVKINIDGSGSVDKPLINSVNYGEKLVLNIIPYDGFYIHSVTFNGYTVVNNKNGEFSYTTPPICKDSELKVVFKKIYWKPEISAFKRGYTDLENGAYVFSKIGSFAAEYELKEFGIALSDTIRGLDKIENRYSADNISVTGNFGIQFKGLELNKNYFAKAYVVYQKDGVLFEEFTNPIFVKVSENQLVNFMNNYGYGTSPIK